MKIFINRSPVQGPWGGGNNFVRAFFDHIPSLGHQVYNSLVRDLDVIFIQDPRPDSQVGISINECIAYKRAFPKTKIVQRINECDARKNTNDIDNLLRECSRFIDKTVFVSGWMKEYHQKKGWHCDDVQVLINGVDSFFSPGERINNGKINIVTHHWSDNYLKGFDVYDYIDDLAGKREDITFTYIGRERGTFKNTNVIAPLFGRALGEELRKYDIYISGSRNDPGPNHILESIACGIPTYSHVEGGGSCEFTGISHVFSRLEDIDVIVSQKNLEKNDFQVKSWYDCMCELNENTLLKC